MSILQDLERITDFSEGGADVRNSLSICQKCILNTSPYALCFYRQHLSNTSQFNTECCNRKNNNQVKIMFISRDPNIEPRKINTNPTSSVVSWKPPQKQGLGFFFCDFLVNNNLWNEFVTYLRNTQSSLVPRFYWTHMVKCYASNNKHKVDAATCSCINYLCEEIKSLNPRLIICAGLDIAVSVYRCMNLALPNKIEFKKFVPLNKKTAANKYGVIVIPHPSRKWYQLWKQNKFKIGITFEELRSLIDSSI